MMVIITVMVDGGRERGEYFFNAVALKTDFFLYVSGFVSQILQT